NPLMAPRTAATRWSTSPQPSSCSSARSTASTWPRMRRTRFNNLVFSRIVWVTSIQYPPYLFPQSALQARSRFPILIGDGRPRIDQRGSRDLLRGKAAGSGGPLMGWSGRAPAPSASEAGKGRKGEEHAMSQPVSTTIAVMGIDIGKNSFHVVGLDQRGAIVLRQRWSRSQVARRLA